MNENRGTLWEVVERFHHEPLMVEISRANASPPRFSIRVGWKNGERQGPWIPVDTVAPFRTVADIAGPLIASAEAYVKHEMEQWQIVEDLRAASQRDELEQRRAADAAKKQKYLQNKEQRRTENRQRSQQSGGGGKKRG